MSTDRTFGSSPGRGPGINRPSRRRWIAARLGAAPVALALAAGVRPVAAHGQAAPQIGDVTVFASAPSPGHPFGIAVDGDRVYVSTSAGDFFAPNQNNDDERVFAYGDDGQLLETTVIDTAANSDMGLFGLAVDGNRGANHKLYVADMNGRILRLGTGPHPGAPELFSQVPAPLGGNWMSAMWNDLAFDQAGNLYVPDDKPRIWRVSPDGTPEIWFTDPRLAGFFGFAGGPLGGRIDPTGQWLYVSITASAEFPLEAVIYKVRLVGHPTADDLVLVHRFPFDPSAAPPQATGLAFARSGNLYVSLLGPNQVAVLDPAGNEIGRISDPRFHSPWGLAFMGKSLLVTNGDLEPGDHPDAWKIFKVNVGETGLPLIQPTT